MLMWACPYRGFMEVYNQVHRSIEVVIVIHNLKHNTKAKGI